MRSLRREAWAFFILLLSHSAFAQKSDYKLEISNLHKKESNKKNITLEFDLSNVGEEDLELPYQTPLANVDIQFEENEKSKALLAYHTLIIQKLANKNIDLPVGAVKSGLRMTFPLQKKEIYREKKQAQVIDSVKVMKAEILTQDSISLTEKKDPIIQKPLSKKDSGLVKSSSDFIIDSIWIIEQKKKSARLGISIQNIGNQEVRIWGESAESNDNLAIKAYLSSLDHVTNSAYFLRGLYVEDEAKPIGGILDAGQRLHVMMEISLKLKTKFNPYILLEINALQNITESNNANNFKAIRLN